MSKEATRPDIIKWFSELSNKDVPIAGGKGASLSEMYNTKVPVPPGFVVTAQAYSYFIKKTKIEDDIKRVLKDLNVDDTAALNQASKDIRKTIEGAILPKEMEEEIVEAYEMLDVGNDGGKEALEILEKNEEPFVAVRSSATTEDLVDASFAGQQDTFLNVRGKEDLLDKTKKCMSSLFTARAIYYRAKKGFDHSKAYLSVVVQKMVDSEKSGVMFSQNPISDDKSIVIEAVWGLGEGIVSGQIKPDHYVVDKDLDNFEIVEEKVAVKKIAIIRNAEGHNQTVPLKEERAKKKVLDNYEIKGLAQYARQLEEHYDKPQDIEFAIDKTGIYIVQSRPITTQFKKAEGGEVQGNVLLSGLGASPGVASGPVKIVHDLSELEKVQEGDVMVAEMTNPDMVVSMQRASAIITDEGGVTSHAAIVSREMGIPAVVGTGEATSKLKDGDIVTVDGNVGKIIEGKGETKLVEILPVVPTKTKIKVIADLPEGAERAAKSGAKYIGLTRLEGIIAIGGKHPLGFVKDKEMDKYTGLIYESLKKMIKPYDGMWVRSSDIRSDEYSGLKGAPPADESNPMMGDHGIRFSLKHRDILKAEFTAIKEIADEFPKKKIGLMVPLLISVDELKKTKEVAKEVGLTDNIQIGVMVETPAAVQIIEELCQEGLDFISFGTNDLTQFTLALDRNNEDVQNLYSALHPAVLREIEHVVKVCREYGVETSICGQAGSKPEMAKFLVGCGIDSISVNADAAKQISEIVAEIEKDRPVEEETVVQNPPGEVLEARVAVPSGAKAPQKDLENEDIEETILKELGGDEDDEYQPGMPNGNKDVPPLNEAMPVGSEMFQQMAEAEDAVEDELMKESQEQVTNSGKIQDKKHH
ncbi:MAG: phosphoenolpyruvate synthase [archaeon]